MSTSWSHFTQRSLSYAVLCLKSENLHIYLFFPLCVHSFFFYCHFLYVSLRWKDMFGSGYQQSLVLGQADGSLLSGLNRRHCHQVSSGSYLRSRRGLGSDRLRAAGATACRSHRSWLQATEWNNTCNTKRTRHRGSSVSQTNRGERTSD